MTNVQCVHHIRQTHDAQADAPHPVGGITELGHGRHIGIGLHDIVEKMRGCCNGLFQILPIYFTFVRDMLSQVDGTKTAIFIRAKPLLAARICRFKIVQVRDWIFSVGGVQEEDARLTIAVCVGCDLIEEFSRPDRTHHHAGAGID